jgi:hypothetical protein
MDRLVLHKLPREQREGKRGFLVVCGGVDFDAHASVSQDIPREAAKPSM